MNYRGDKTNFLKEVESFAAQLQEIEDALWTIYDLRSVKPGAFDSIMTDSNTTANFLDDIGGNVGLLRGGMTDRVYLPAILAKINQNRSCGEPERLIKALKDITAATRVWYGEIQPESRKPCN
jgi:hypothetical protein